MFYDLTEVLLWLWDALELFLEALRKLMRESDVRSQVRSDSPSGLVSGCKKNLIHKVVLF